MTAQERKFQDTRKGMNQVEHVSVSDGLPVMAWSSGVSAPIGRHT